jgi:hypothetical protein
MPQARTKMIELIHTFGIFFLNHNNLLNSAIYVNAICDSLEKENFIFLRKIIAH